MKSTSKNIPFCDYKIPFCDYEIPFCDYKAIFAFDLKNKFLDVKAGVPQGSRLGPLLWILYNQDIIDDLESECLLYADDTCLFAFGKDPVDSVEMLNRDLAKIGLWADKWKVLF